MRRPGLLAALLAALVLLVGLPARAADPLAADTARYLAGMTPQPGSPLERFTGDGSFKEHKSTLDGAWSRLERGQLSRIRTWSEKTLPSRRPTLFYMFSGPDYLYANAFFPDALTYVLSGLEPVGPIPQVTEANRRQLTRLRNGISSVLNLSFFKTVDMRSDFSSGAFSGTLPVLMIFLARSGKVVEEVGLVTLDAAGEAVAPGTSPAGREQQGRSRGARIVFSDGDGERTRRTLYYFQTDVSNSGRDLAAFLDFCRKLGSGDAFVKSASYLMHSESFSRVRNFLLEQAHLIVQDDSGIPLRHFKRQDWILRPAGRYLGPIGLFSGQYQGDLRDLFAKGEPLALDFGIGYRYRQSESNLLVAVRKPQ